MLPVALNGSGSLQLTAAANDQSGAFIIADPNAGAPVYGFTARFDMHGRRRHDPAGGRLCLCFRHRHSG